ncbi:MAG: hypothetical protein Q9161_005782 [Pseudevernia consocians]
MTNPATPKAQSQDVADYSTLPDASELENTVTAIGDSANSRHRRLSFLLSTDTDALNDSQYNENDSSITASNYQGDIDEPLFSNIDDSEYHRSGSSTPTLPTLRSQGTTEEFGFRDTASTPGNQHVIDEYSFLSDACDADQSRNFATDFNHLSYLPNASQISDTTIKMENSIVPEISEVERSGHRTGISAQGEVVEPRFSLTIASLAIDNLFFRTEDGRVLAIRISSTLGPELLRGLSKQIGPLTSLPALPFAIAPSTTADDDLANDAQALSLTANASTAAPSTAPVPSKAASSSTNTSASVRGASAALSEMSRQNSGGGIIVTDALADRIFSSTDGKPYDRDWIKTHNVKQDILKGIPSKHKLDLLVRHGAVVVGDKLCVTYNSSGNPVIIEGEVLQGSTSTNLCVRIAPAREDSDGILRSIQGPRDLIGGMNDEYTSRYDHAVQGGWKDVELRSSTGQDIGTLYDVRQAYQVWADQKAKWVARNSLATV